ncbi:hypothetical protein CVD28_02110 [Bacillus sp. M6-12]|uniref:hypothetical protein n=1 Tax=Bacillus sp. M6-12 TaxID=2054166 RepID=UPI000C762F93|nr:hypothetical protein [Bacillus sp. M6-12]PLS19226.1 hypothetical protein CVD28_02110 [Bacillus sp. M6-12]
MKTKNKIMLGLGVTVAMVSSLGVESFATSIVQDTTYQATGKFVDRIETQKDPRTGRYISFKVLHFQTGSQFIPVADNDRAVAQKYGMGKTITVKGKFVNTVTGKRVLDIDTVSGEFTSYKGTGKFIQVRDVVKSSTGKTSYVTNVYFQAGTQMFKVADNDRATVLKYGYNKSLTVEGKVSYPEGKATLDVDKVSSNSSTVQASGKFIVRNAFDTLKGGYVPTYYLQTTQGQLYRLADNDKAVVLKYGLNRHLTVVGEMLYSVNGGVLDIDKVLDVTDQPFATLPVK